LKAGSVRVQAKSSSDLMTRSKFLSEYTECIHMEFAIHCFTPLARVVFNVFNITLITAWWNAASRVQTECLSAARLQFCAKSPLNYFTVKSDFTNRFSNEDTLYNTYYCSCWYTLLLNKRKFMSKSAKIGSGWQLNVFKVFQPLIFRPQIALLVILIQRYVFTKFLRLSYFEKIESTNRQKNRRTACNA